MLIKATFKDSKKLKELEIMEYTKMLRISIFFDIGEIADFQSTKADVSRNQGVCHVIYKFFGSSLGKL